MRPRGREDARGETRDGGNSGARMESEAREARAARADGYVRAHQRNGHSHSMHIANTHPDEKHSDQTMNNLYMKYIAMFLLREINRRNVR